MVWDGNVGGTGGGGGYTPPAPASLARLTINAQILSADFASLGLTGGAAGHIALPAWSAPAVEIGSAFDYATDSFINILDPGVYAVTFTLFPQGIEDCAVTTSLRFAADPFWGSVGDCGVRGGDSEEYTFAHPSSSYTAFVAANPGDPGDEGPIAFRFVYTDFDATNLTAITFQVSIQQLLVA